MAIEVDAKRNCPAVPFDWKAADYPGYGEPGHGCHMYGDCLVFACPGCGRFGSIRVGSPKPDESPSWDIVGGVLSDITTLTLSPSINCVGCCHWHGYLKSGQFVSC